MSAVSTREFQRNFCTNKEIACRVKNGANIVGYWIPAQLIKEGKLLIENNENTL
jgi:hypothetical protein